MPVRNEERYVVGAIRSIIEQGIPVEVLVIDACSSDRTVSCVEGLYDPRIRVITNPARLIPNALNIGLQHARGEFIARVDAHACIGKDYFSNALKALSAQDVGGVGGMKVGVAGSPAGRAIAAALSSRFGVGNSIYHYGKQAVDTDHASFGVYRAAVARSIGGWDETLAVNEDVDFDHRILAAGWRIRYQPTMTINWQVRESIGAFARQYRRYGRGKAAMLRKNGFSALRARHLMPPALVLATGFSLFTGLAGRRRFAVAFLTPYCLALAGATILTLRAESSKQVISPSYLAAAFVTMHFSWGWGMFEGLVLGLKPAGASALDPA